MFNLIVNILAVLLMIGVAVAGLTYLGPAFTNAQTKATFAAMLNAGEQFQGAEALFKADNGGTYGAVTDLVPYYLSAQPVTPTAFVAGAGWSIVQTAAVAAVAASGSTPATAATAAGTSAVLDLSKAKVSAAVAVCALVPASAPFGCDSLTAPTKFSFSL